MLQDAERYGRHVGRDDQFEMRDGMISNPVAIPKHSPEDVRPVTKRAWNGSPGNDLLARPAPQPPRADAGEDPDVAVDPIIPDILSLQDTLPREVVGCASLKQIHFLIVSTSPCSSLAGITTNRRGSPAVSSS